MSDWPFGLLRQSAYGVIYADPAWRFEGYNEASSGVPQRAPDQHYDTMTVAEMAELPVWKLAAPDCALLMWGTSSHLKQGIWLAERWGFEYSSKAFGWSKLNPHAERNHLKKFIAWADGPRDTQPPRLDDPANWKIGMGHGTRRNTEDCWLFTRGKPKRLDMGVRELIVAPVGEHSRKPHETYDRIERLFGGPYAELFSRNTRAGWSSWGNQTTKFD